MHYIRRKNNGYLYSDSLMGLFKDLVKTPFENQPKTGPWLAEVRSRESDYHREKILDRGLTNFGVPFNGLSPDDKVLIYCNYYMPIHLFSSYHIFGVHSTLFANLLASVDNNVVFIDFGCGPLTSGIAFWAFARQSNIFYLGIDSSQAMRAKAENVNQYGPYGHFQFLDPFYSRFKLIDSFTKLPKLLDNILTRHNESLIIFNFCYFLASQSLDANNLNTLSDVMVRIVEAHSNQKMCMVYQNPNSPKLHKNWEILKADISGFRSKVTPPNVQQFRYTRLSDGLPHDISVYCDILYKD